MHRTSLVFVAACAAALAPFTMLIAKGDAQSTPRIAAASPVQAGRYLVQIGGCNDCHTPGFMQTPEKIPESRWLTGTSLGFRGPWGVSYPVNLRNLVAGMSERRFQALLHEPMLPPMPAYVFSRMSDADRHALYAYIKSLGPAGKDAPKPVPPGRVPKTPVIDFVPVPVREAMKTPAH